MARTTSAGPTPPRPDGCCRRPSRAGWMVGGAAPGLCDHPASPCSTGSRSSFIASPVASTLEGCRPFAPTTLTASPPSSGADPEWETLHGLGRSEIFLFVKDMRDGHVHRMRLPAELHGAFVTGGIDASGRYQSTLGADPDIQWALATALFRDVICPAIEAAGAIVARRTTPFDERGVRTD